MVLRVLGEYTQLSRSDSLCKGLVAEVDTGIFGKLYSVPWTLLDYNILEKRNHLGNEMKVTKLNLGQMQKSLQAMFEVLS